MSKRLILVLALAFVVSMTAYAFAEVQNVKVGGDITIRGVARNNFNLNGTNSDRSNMMDTTRVKITADLTDNVIGTVMFANERDWSGTVTNSAGTATGSTAVTLWLSNVTLKEFLYSPLTLTVGRQGLSLGNKLILGDPNTNLAGTTIANPDLSMARAFDAIKAVLDYDPLTVTMILAKLNENNVAVSDDQDLMAINAAYVLDNGVLAEAYFIGREQDAVDTVAFVNDSCYAVGARVAGDVNDKLNLQAEVAMQMGDQRTLGTIGANRDAMAVQLMGSYKIDANYSPMLSASYTYLSGDDSADGDVKAWDPMYEDQTPGGILNALMAASNAHLINLKGSIKPSDDTTMILNYVHARLDESLTAGAQRLDGGSLGVTSGATYVMTSDKDVGDEVDLTLVYDYTEDVKLSLEGGLFFPGDAFDSINNRTASQVIGTMKITF